MGLRNFHYFFALIIVVAICGTQSSPAQADSVDNKYTLIAAYVYNFTQHTVWPASAADKSFTVCVAGQDPFGSNLEPIKSRKVNDEKIAVRHLGRSDGDVSGCNLLFVSASEKSNLKSILQPLKGNPVLTLSDIAGFSNAGGMVEFKMEEGKIGIWVALSAVRVTGLSISSKILSLENMNIR